MQVGLILHLMFAVYIALFSVTAEAGNAKPVVAAQIKLGETFLKERVMSDQYYLDCKASDTHSMCPVGQAGKIISAFYIINLLVLDHALNNEVKNVIVKMLDDEHKKPLWGYSKNSPPDLDDTSMALQTLFLLDIPQDIQMLSLFYHSKTNAYATFVNQVFPRFVITPSTENNVGLHPEVNAIAYNLLHLFHKDKQINFNMLAKLQNKQGDWPGYFYNGKYYSTYLNMKLFCSAHRGPSQVKLGLQFIRKTQHDNGSWGSPGNSYDTALALNTLLDCGQIDGVEKGINYLLHQQGRKGDWSTDQTIWSFVYQDQPFIVWQAYDTQHVLTTALSLLALKKYSLRVAQEPGLKARL